MERIIYFYVEIDTQVRIDIPENELKSFFQKLFDRDIREGDLIVKDDEAMRVHFDLTQGKAHLVGANPSKTIHMFYGDNFQQIYAGPVEKVINEIRVVSRSPSER